MVESFTEMNKNKAFTLVELLIVMSVLALLMTIPILMVKGLQDEARKAKAQGDLRTLKVAIESFYKNHGNQYPTQQDYQTLLMQSAPRLIENVLYDPFGETSTTLYRYALSGTGPNDSSYYILYSKGVSKNGIAVIDANGNVTASFDAIWDSNTQIK